MPTREAPAPTATRHRTRIDTGRDSACPGCGLVLRRHNGPTHAYVGASPACWDLYRRLATPPSIREQSNRLRRLIRAAYAAQHPGLPQRRSVQSVAVHLMDLCVLLERDGEDRRLVPVLGRMPPRRTLDLHWLEPPRPCGKITVSDALEDGPDPARVEAWARDVWAAWEPHQPTVRRWLDAPCARPA